MNIPKDILHRSDEGFFIRQKTWTLLLKIEQRGQLEVFPYTSKTVRLSQILSIAEMILFIRPTNLSI